VGPETKNALPSAQKFKDKLLRQVRLGSRVRLWRPVAALAVAVSAAVVYVEDQPSVNPDHPKATQPLASGFVEHHVDDSLDPPDKLISRLQGFKISKPTRPKLPAYQKFLNHHRLIFLLHLRMKLILAVSQAIIVSKYPVIRLGMEEGIAVTLPLVSLFDLGLPLVATNGL